MQRQQKEQVLVSSKAPMKFMARKDESQKLKSKIKGQDKWESEKSRNSTARKLKVGKYVSQ